MSNSPLVNYVKISPHRNSPRNHKIDKITIHHMAGNLSVETCGNVFQSREASSNYGIDSNGRVGMYVEEKDRSWCSSSGANDHRAVTIEVADDTNQEPWHSSDAALAKLIELCVDICRRNGIARLNYTGDASGNLTRHNMFTATECPGEYLQSKFPYIAAEVNKRLGASQATAATYKPPQDSSRESTFLPARGFFRYGDNCWQVGKIAEFLRRVFPLYTPKAALGNYFGPNLLKAVKEYQRRSGLEADGNIGPITLKSLEKSGFKY